MDHPLAQFDTLWVLISAVLVLVMQLGFLCLESGLTRSKNSINVALKNAADFVLVLLLFWVAGFGVMYGSSWQGILGIDGWAPDFLSEPGKTAAFFLFQSMFCATAVTIVSGAVAERMRFNADLVLSALVALVALVIYPISGHWAWTGALGGGQGWLASLGFVDFAGSTIVHSVGGWVALAAVLVLGARHDRFADGCIQRMTPSNVHLAFMGVIFFLVGWVGFNGGSTLAFNQQVPGIIVNTLLAAAAGALFGYCLESWLNWPGLDQLVTPMNGCLAGLVAITASAHSVTSFESCVIGAIGVVFMVAVDQCLLRLKIDDAIGAVGVHLGAGVWGTLAVALFGAPELLGTGLSAGQQLLAQVTGIVAVGLWAFGVALIVLFIANRWRPLRVDLASEKEGLNIAEHGASTDLNDLLRAMDEQQQLADVSNRVPVVPFTEVGQIAQRYNSVMASLEAAVRQTQAIVRDIRDGIVTFDASGTLTSFNPAAESIFATTSIESVGRPVQSLFDQERKIRRDTAPKLFDYMQLGQTVEVLGQRRGQLNNRFRMEVTVTEGLVNGQPQYTAVIRDVHERRKIEDQLFKEKERALVTLGSIADGVITTDETGAVVYLNRAAEHLTGWDLVQASKQPVSWVYRTDQSSEQDLQEDLRRILEGLQPKSEYQQTTLQSKTGTEYPVSHIISPIKDKYGQVFGAVIVFHDDSSARALQHRLSYQATHDALTGVLNRSGFEMVAQRLLNRCMQTGEQHVLGFIDLDRFKIVNDSCGHAAGDELLRQLTRVIRSNLRNDDTLARLGGDEFALLLHNCDENNGVRIAEIICQAVAGFRFAWQDKTFGISASIGLVKMDKSTPSMPKVMSLADSACYSAKDAGRNRVVMYSPTDSEVAERRGQIEWVSRIRNALDNDGFRLFFQPIVPAGSTSPGGPMHAEIFIRMVGEGDTLLPPGAFVPTAERYNLIQELDMWVVKNTLAWLSDRSHSSPPMVCAINLSGPTIGDKRSLDNITQYFDHYQVAGATVCFEITETAAIGNLDAATRFISSLKAIGCSFALDDFGSGLSSYGYLKSLPVDYLKIDGVFIRDIVSNRVDRVMVQSIHSLGHELGLKTIAEFVETQAIVEELKLIGVDYLQGYHIAKPAPLENFAETRFMPR